MLGVKRHSNHRQLVLMLPEGFNIFPIEKLLQLEELNVDALGEMQQYRL